MNPEAASKMRGKSAPDIGSEASLHSHPTSALFEVI
jgi:hypothetical protein